MSSEPISSCLKLFEKLGPQYAIKLKHNIFIYIIKINNFMVNILLSIYRTHIIEFIKLLNSYS